VKSLAKASHRSANRVLVELVESGLDVEVPAGDFSRCVQVDETTPLEPGHVSVKLYCPEVGLVADGPAELVSFRRDD
jgi:hypothetical protein